MIAFVRLVAEIGTVVVVVATAVVVVVVAKVVVVAAVVAAAAAAAVVVRELIQAKQRANVTHHSCHKHFQHQYIVIPAPLRRARQSLDRRQSKGWECRQYQP